MMIHRVEAVRPDGFLTVAEVPPNKTWRPDDRVRLTIPRRVLRVGYRRGLDDAAEAVPHVAEQAIAELYAATCGVPTPPPWQVSRRASRLVNRALQSMWLTIHGMGGCDRGVHWMRVSADPETIYTVIGKRMARVGTYYPPCGSGEDYEPGGLSPSRVVVLVQLTSGFERFSVMAGDLETAP